MPPSHPAPNTRAYLALWLGIFAISFNGIFVKLANTCAEVAGFYRLAIATVILSIPVFLKWQSSRQRVPAGVVLLGVCAGFALAADLGMWNRAVLIIGPGMATLLGNTAPIWVALGAFLIFKERLRPLYWTGLGVALVGAALIVRLDALQGLKTSVGNLLGLGTGVA